MFGPIYDREVIVLPRRPRHYVARLIFAGGLFSLICTAWLLLAGIQPVRNLGDLARFGTLVFQFLAPIQVLILAFMAALAGVNVVAHEKDRRTLVLLLLTSLSNREVVLGKVAGGLLPTLNLFLISIPVMMLTTLLGGVSIEQVLGTSLLCLATMLACGALGATMAFWREKTFQSIAATFLTMVLWIAAWEIVASGYVAAIPTWWAVLASPARAILEIGKPIPSWNDYGIWGSVAMTSSLTMFGVFLGLTLMAIACLRVWNPSREARPATPESDEPEPQTTSENADPNVRPVLEWKSRKARPVWNRPILWREMCTWAYGRKVLIVRLAYLAFFLICGTALMQSLDSGAIASRSVLEEELIPTAARYLAPFFVVSLIIINALAVNSITNERDGQALDFLLVTEISPLEFIFSKILGVLYVAKEMVILPLLLVLFLWYRGGINGENLIFTLSGLIVMDLFVAMLGIHCGMIYSQSRAAIAVSLATVFFLFLGVVTCMLIMISFRGSFGRQLAPFLAIILGGGAGLFMALGHRNPSPAITIASFGLPFLTFFAITSFILRNQELTVFSVICVSYAFATAAMLIPALSEFDFANDRARTVDDEG